MAFEVSSVAALNPHAGNGGNFGREEIDVIRPALKRMAEHQIALKLMGFDRGVTVQGGIPFPVTTPAHGTAFDIACHRMASAFEYSDLKWALAL